MAALVPLLASSPSGSGKDAQNGDEEEEVLGQQALFRWVEKTVGEEKVWPWRAQDREERDAPSQARDAEVGQGPPSEGEEPKASHCHRALRGAQEGREGTAQKEGCVERRAPRRSKEPQLAVRDGQESHRDHLAS